MKVTGATLFVVDAGVDTGPIVAQSVVPVEDDDTVETLHERIKVAERTMLVDAVGRMAREGFTITDRKVRFGLMSTPQQSEMRIPIKRALVSVYDKSGLEELVRGLHDAGVTLVSTGGSAALIESLGLPVTRVEELTGFPECLDGRVKTLHPKVHAGILADRRLDSHVAQLAELGVEPFDLVVSNLYPFTQTVHPARRRTSASSRSTSAAPRWCAPPPRTTPRSRSSPRPDRYADVLAAAAAGGFTLDQRRGLAAEAFVHTATYDVAVASWMGSVLTDSSAGTGFPAWLGGTWDKAAGLRYGENPHQPAALYTNGFQPEPGLAQATQLHGKEMSYNNYVDADAARRAAYDFDQPTVAIIKHANPCGIAVGTDVAEAHRRPTRATRSRRSVGSSPPTCRSRSRWPARSPRSSPRSSWPPRYEDGAVEILTAKKNIRLLECAAAGPRWRRDAADLRRPAAPAARPGRRRGRRPGQLDPRHRRGRLARGARRPRLRLDAPAAR